MRCGKNWMLEMLLLDNNLVQILYIRNTCNTSLQKVCKGDNPIASSRRTTPVQEQGKLVQDNATSYKRTSKLPTRSGPETIISSSANTTFSTSSYSSSGNKETINDQFNGNLCKEVAKTLEGILISSIPLHNTCSYSSTGNHH